MPPLKIFTAEEFYSLGLLDVNDVGLQAIRVASLVIDDGKKLAFTHQKSKTMEEQEEDVASE